MTSGSLSAQSQAFPTNPQRITSPALESETSSPFVISQPRPSASISDSLEPEHSFTQVPETITVEQFKFVGNTVFSEQELAQVTQSYTKRPLSWMELLQARSAVTQLYVDRGYVTSGAYIPPQTLDQGVVTLAIVEGTLEMINVEVKGRLKPSYVRDRLALATSKPLNLPHLVEALRLLQLNPLIKRISAELSAGSRPGTNLLEVKVETASSFSLKAILDNQSTPLVGSFARKVELNEANLFGYGDNFNLSYTNTDGSDAVDTAYTLPVNARNGTIQIAFQYSSNGIIEEPFDDLDGDNASPDITSNYRDYEITLRQPIIQTPNQELALGLTAQRQESDNFLLDIPFPLSPGADEEGKVRISTLRFFQEWTQRSDVDVVAFRSQFSFGIDVFDATVNEQLPDSRYFTWQGQAQWVRLLAPDTLFLARTNLQLASTSLVPLEQFTLGGLESVRGYRQDVLLTDNGVFASVEVRLPILRIPQQAMVIQLVPFIDFGAGWNNDGRAPDPNTLASVGLGLRYQWSDRLTARFDWGIPLVEVNSATENTTLQDHGLYFSVIYHLF